MPGSSPRPSARTDADVVLVVYRSRSHVETLLETWPADLGVVVVDNSADVDGVSEVAGAHPNARYVDGGGQGFARAANLGAATASRPFVVFVNPDCRPTIDDLDALVSGLHDDATAIAHAATMTDGRGSVEMGVGGWEPSVGRVVVHSLGLHRLFPRAGLFARPAPGEVCSVDWVTGACMAVRTDQFRGAGGFDETFFVYAEDIAFGRRARELGLRTVLRADVQVAHGSGNSGAPSAEMLRLRGASFAGYTSRYHPPTRALAMQLGLAVGQALRALTAVVKRDRAGAVLQLAFVRGVLTRRAYVGGTEVAERRYTETAQEPDRPHR